MDDIGNIVYVIAVVGYMVYRVFVGKKEKQPNQQETPQRGTTIEDILKEFTQPEQPKPEPVYESRESKKEHEGHVHDAKPFLTVDAPGGSTRPYKMSEGEVRAHQRVVDKKSINEIEIEDQVDEVAEELSNGVDLRRAIIYQTILETPYLRHV